MSRESANPGVLRIHVYNHTEVDYDTRKKKEDYDIRCSV